MRLWIVLFLAAIVCGALGYRVFALEARVKHLARGAPPEPPATRIAAHPEGPPATAHDAVAPVEAAAQGEHARRLVALEADIAALRKELEALAEAARQKADRADVDRSASADRILGLVSQEVMRVRDRQVEFHRDRWIEMRSRAVDEFVARHGLAASQANTIRRLLVDEVDEMVAIFKAQGAEDDPKVANEEWIDMLRATDREAKRVLDPAQSAAWDQGRAYERRVFMPWLPQ